MIETEKYKNGKCFVIYVLILPDHDELIKRTFAYWHTRTLHVLATRVTLCCSRASGLFNGEFDNSAGYEHANM